MKLSEAIRLGSMTTLQCSMHFHEYGPDGTEYTCALGSALDAVGELVRYPNFFGWYKTKPEELWPILKTPASSCPVEGCTHIKDVFGTVPEWQTLRSVVPHLNNDHKWTRQAIADLVEQIEKQHEAQAAPVEEPAVVA